MSAVVLNGAGWVDRALRAFDLRDRARARSGHGFHHRGGSILGLEPLRRMRRDDLLAVSFELALHRPVRLGHERVALALPVHDVFQRGRLDAACREDIAPGALGSLVGGGGEIAREDRAPDQVYVLTGRTRLGQVIRYHARLAERLLDLVLGDRRETAPHDRHVGIHLEHERAGIGADELAFAIVVGGDVDLVGLLGEVLYRADDALLRGQAQDIGTHELGQLIEAPLAELLGEVDLHDVALEADAHPVLAIAAELVDRRRVDLVARPADPRQGSPRCGEQRCSSRI